MPVRLLCACESPKEITFPDKNGWKDCQWQQPGRAFYFMLWNQGRTALFSRQFIPKGGRCHTNLLLITLLCEWCSIILVFLAGWAPHKPAKARLWWWWQMVSSLGLVLILPFQMSAFFKKKNMFVTPHFQMNAALQHASTLHTQPGST